MKLSILCLLVMLASIVPAVAAGQSTAGWCSPIQSGNNNTFICNGVDPRAMKRLNDDLDRMDLSLQQKIAEANEWAKKYNELNTRFEETKKKLEAGGEDPTLVKAAQDLLHQGKLEEARRIYDRLIASDERNIDRAAQDHFNRAIISALQFRMVDGNPRIKASSQLLAAYRSVVRPSSPLSAKASTKCPYDT